MLVERKTGDPRLISSRVYKIIAVPQKQSVDQPLLFFSIVSLKIVYSNVHAHLLASHT